MHNEPRQIVETLATGLQRLHEPIAKAFIHASGRGKDLDTITELLTPLLTTEHGVQWLATAHLAAKEIAKRIEADQNGDEEPRVAAPVAASEPNREQFLEDLRNSAKADEAVVTVPNNIGANGHHAEDDEERLL